MLSDHETIEMKKEKLDGWINSCSIFFSSSHVHAEKEKKAKRDNVCPSMRHFIYKNLN